MASPLTATLTMFSMQVGFPVAGILIADKMFQHQRKRKFRYGFAITSFAFGGWLLSSHFTTKYLENVKITLDAESNNPKYDFEEVRQALLEWFDYNLVYTEPYEAKRSDVRIIGLNYTARPNLVDSQGYDTGADPNDYGSAFPQEQSKPVIFEPMNDREGLEEIAFDLENIYNESDGYYFSTQDAYYGGPSEQYQLVFYQKDTMGRQQILYIFQLAKTYNSY